MKIPAICNISEQFSFVKSRNGVILQKKPIFQDYDLFFYKKYAIFQDVLCVRRNVEKMNFLEKDLLWLLPLVFLLTVPLWIASDIWRRRSLKKYLPDSALLVVSYPARWLRRCILLAALLLLALAAARPSWGERPLEVNIADHDVMIVFDLSKSMLAEDVAPSRLEHGKYLVRELVKSNPRNNYGITVFAGRAFPACPLTADRVSIEQCIDDMDCNTMPVGGSNLSEALQVALKSLQVGGNIRRDIVLITDGEELSGDALAILKEIKNKNIRLIVVAPGNPAVPALIPEIAADGSRHFKRDNNGELVRTRINEVLLKKLAAESGGAYFNSNTLNTNLQQINSLLAENGAAGSRNVKRSLPIERFMIFLIIGTLGVVIYMLAGETPLRRKRHLGVIMLGFFCINTLCGAETSTALPENKNEAQKILQDVTDPYQLFAAARKLQLENRLQDAATIYQELQKASVPQAVRYSAMHNLGVIYQQQARKEFEAATQTTTQGNLDGALKNINGGKKLLMEAENLYRNVMTQAWADEALSEAAADAQQQLLLDKADAEKLEKAIEEYKKQLQQTKKDTKDAQDKNQQAQQQNQAHQQAQDALNKAKSSSEDLQKKASELSEKLLQQAQESAEALGNAVEKLEKKDYSGASDNIAEALKKLNEVDSQYDKNEEKTSKYSGEETDDSAEKKEDKKEDKNAGSSCQQQDNKLDEKQSDALLDSMLQDEKDLRNSIKRNRRRNVIPGGKDW